MAPLFEADPDGAVSHGTNCDPHSRDLPTEREGDRSPELSYRREQRIGGWGWTA